jgi:hypothetical protein|tara:strand:- start:532 stop:834 length:303 start_codon:yes stop_codon:yes gene_type:complete
MDNIKKNLTNIVILIGLIGSIGAGFTKYGELTTRLDALSNATAPDLSSIELEITTNELTINDNVKDINSNKVQIEVLKKTIELLELEIKRISVANSNPLG